MNNFDYIKKLLGPVIYSRAIDYYQNKRIVELRELEPGEFYALVKGSGRKFYNVDIDLYDEIYDCDCPYDDYCKHIGAVLIHLTQMGIDFEYTAPPKNADEIRTKLAEIEKEITSQKSIKLDLQPSNSHKTDQISSFLPLEPDKSPKKAQTRYSLVFVISKSYYANRIIIEPNLQYIKKNGLPGRFQKYSKSNLTEPVSAEEQTLLSIIEQSSNTQMYTDTGIELTELLSPNTHHLLEKCKVYTEISYEVVRFHYFERIHLTFEVSQINQNNDVSFTILFKLQLKDETFETFTMEECQCKTGRILFHNNEHIYYSFDVELFMFLTTMMTSIDYNSIKINEIEYLKNYCQQKLPGKVSINFSKTSAVLQSAKPECVLLCRETGDGLGCFIIFRYHEREYPFLRKESLLRLPSPDNDPSIKLVVRNFQYERLMVQQIALLLKGCPVEFNLEDDYHYYHDDFDIIIQKPMLLFLQQHIRPLLDAGYEIRFDNKKFASGGGKAAIRISSGIDWFSVETSYTDDEGNEEAIEIDPLLLKAGIVKTKSGYRALTKEELDKFLSLAKYGLSNKGSLKIARANLSAIHNLYKNKITDDRDTFKSLSNVYTKLSSFKGIKKNTVPKNFNATLRNYQQAGFDWLCFLHEYDINGILADDMGLGKTVQTLALLSKLKEKKDLTTSLLVVPVTTIPNWSSELERFAPKLTFARHIGAGRNRNFEDFGEYDILITSYQTLCRDIEKWQEKELDYLILDESQNIKNAKSQSFKAIKLMNARHRLSLSGTPVENNSTELWAQMDALNPGLLGSLNEFTRNFARPIESGGDTEKAKLLRDMVFPFILRRKKEDVLKDLPPKEEIILYAEMEPRQQKIYETLRKAMKKDIEKLLSEDQTGDSNNGSINKHYMPILAAMLKLRQIALFPQLVNDRYRGTPSCKFDMLRDYIMEIFEEGHKVLLFSQFVQTLSIIRGYFDEEKINYSYIDGQTKNRAAEIKKFQEKKDVPLFLISLKAGGVGINLTAADYVILFDPWWNPAVENQAIDRAHRIGQQNKVIVYRLIVKNTIEEKILELQKKKKSLADSLISDDTNVFKSLNKEDVLQLFE
jgi:superfamily II DNA or RNA helicase